MMGEKLSVALIGKDAEEYLDRCLSSVQWADEIVFLDGHSSDRTREIAESYDAIIIEKDFESFPIERDYVLKRTSNNWVLSLDVDMIVPPALAKEIQELLAGVPGCDGYLMRCLNHFIGREIRHCSWFDHRFLRLFNKKKGSYDFSKKVLDHYICRGKVGRLKNFLVHHQTESLEVYIQKMSRRYAPFTADEYIKMGVCIKPWNIPWYFLIKPSLVFIYKYIWKRGFLDGLPGFIVCLNSAILYYFIYSIIWDRQKGQPDYNLEQYLPDNSDNIRGD